MYVLYIHTYIHNKDLRYPSESIYVTRTPDRLGTAWPDSQTAALATHTGQDGRRTAGIQGRTPCQPVAVAIFVNAKLQEIAP